MTSEVFQSPFASYKLWLLTLIIQSEPGAIIETKVINGKSFFTSRSATFFMPVVANLPVSRNVLAVLCVAPTNSDQCAPEGTVVWSFAFQMLVKVMLYFTVV